MEFSLSRDIHLNWAPFSIFITIALLLLFRPVVSEIFAIILFILTLSYYTFKLTPQTKSNESESLNEQCILGHRGCINVERDITNNNLNETNHNIVEGSLEAFKYAWDNGANGIEFDIRFTKDNHPIIFHNYHIRNITNFSICDICRQYDSYSHFEYGKLKNKAGKHYVDGGCGCIHKLTLKQLKLYSYIGKEETSVNKIPTLEQLIHFMGEHKYMKKSVTNEPFILFFELKHIYGNYSDKQLELLINMLKEGNISFDRIVFVSFSVRILYRLRRKYKFIKTGLIFERHMYMNWIYKRGAITSCFLRYIYRFIDPIRTLLCQWMFPYFIGCNFVGLPYFLISKYLINHYNQYGINVFCWGANDEIDVKYLLKNGVICVCDDPRFAKQICV